MERRIRDMILLFALLISSVPISESSEVKNWAAREAVVPLIKCKVCEKLANQLYQQVSKKQAQISPEDVSNMDRNPGEPFQPKSSSEEAEIERSAKSIKYDDGFPSKQVCYASFSIASGICICNPAHMLILLLGSCLPTKSWEAIHPLVRQFRSVPVNSPVPAYIFDPPDD